MELRDFDSHRLVRREDQYEAKTEIVLLMHMEDVTCAVKRKE